MGKIFYSPCDVGVLLLRDSNSVQRDMWNFETRLSTNTVEGSLINSIILQEAILQQLAFQFACVRKRERERKRSRAQKWAEVLAVLRWE